MILRWRSWQLSLHYGVEGAIVYSFFRGIWQCVLSKGEKKEMYCKLWIYFRDAEGSDQLVVPNRYCIFNGNRQMSP